MEFHAYESHTTADTNMDTPTYRLTDEQHKLYILCLQQGKIILVKQVTIKMVL